MKTKIEFLAIGNVDLNSGTVKCMLKQK